MLCICYEFVEKTHADGVLDFSLDLSGLEGAVGYTPPPDEQPIPKWQDPQEEEISDEMSEVRKRRLERFSSNPSSPKTEKENDLDLD